MPGPNLTPLSIGRAAAHLAAGLLSFVRDARWITADRVAAAAPMALLAMIGAALYLVAINPVWSSDYLSFWAASRLTLQGTPAASYDLAVHFAAQAVAPDSGWAVFLYPPVFLLLCWPLALLPFGPSAVAWVIATGVTMAVAIRRQIPSVPGALAAAAAYPAAWFNMAAGQNGFLTASLFGFGLGWLDRAPIAAGVCFGCLAYKPQFAIIVPVALVATSRWRVLLSAAVTAAGLVAASVAAFGIETWEAFFQAPANAQKILGTAAEAPGKMISVMGALLTLHAPAWLAYSAQGAVVVAVCCAMALFAKHCARPGPLGAALCACSALASPWLHRYDLTLLAIPMAWLVSEGIRTGFRPWEKSVLLTVWWLPLFSGPLAMQGHVSVETPMILVLLTLIWRRERHGFYVQGPGAGLLPQPNDSP